MLTLDSGAAAGTAANAGRRQGRARRPRRPCIAIDRGARREIRGTCYRPLRAPGPGAATYAGRADVECEMLVLGAGPGGYSAAFRAADLGMKTVLVERYASLGGVCLNVGCIPSKALLHTAAVIDEVKAMGAHGITYGAPAIDLDKLRGFKEGVVKKLTGGLMGMAKARKVDVIRGIGRFLDAHHIEVQVTSGTGREPTAEKKVVRFAEGDHRGRQRGGEAAVHARRSAHRRFHRRADAAVDAEADARRRRRHHRARDGERLFVARHADRRRRDARRRDDRR